MKKDEIDSSKFISNSTILFVKLRVKTRSSWDKEGQDRIDIFAVYKSLTDTYLEMYCDNQWRKIPLEAIAEIEMIEPARLATQLSYNTGTGNLPYPKSGRDHKALIYPTIE